MMYRNAMKAGVVAAMMFASAAVAPADAAQSAKPCPSKVEVSAGKKVACGQDVRNFMFRGEAWLSKGAEASLWFHTDSSGKGYEVLFHNGPSTERARQVRSRTYATSTAPRCRTRSGSRSW